MRDVRVALAQIAPKLGCVDENLALHEAQIERARAEGAEIVVFPELSLTGYVLRDMVPDVALLLDSPLLKRVAAASSQIDVLLGFVEETEGHLFHNSAAYFSKGRLIHIHRKLYLPTYGLFQEGRDFAAGEQLRRFDTDHGPTGILICEDLWHPTSTWLLALDGAEVVFCLSNGPTRGTRPDLKITSIGVWKRLLRVNAQFRTSFMLYVNRVGCEDGLTFGGGSLAVDPFGRVIAELPALDEAMAVVELSDEVLRRARMAYPLLRDENLELAQRELERIRRTRYGLSSDGRDDGEESR